MNPLTVSDRTAWRQWLENNHDQVDEVWLVYFKKGSEQSGLGYEESVEEAVCFGWIDSLIKKIDEERYARKFTPRTEESQWSESNKSRVRRMIEAGLMTEHGMTLVEAAKASGRWEEVVTPPKLEYDLHPDFQQALKSNPAAEKTFNNLASSYQKQYTGWINQAKRGKTRQKRIQEAIQLLASGRKLGLK
jgi:uncharacterized protein YdeI (YjbR/CyaY-like superfamily)